MTGNGTLDSWDGFVGINFLKAENVKDVSKPYKVEDVEFDAENGRPRLVLHEEAVDNVSWLFDLNVSNSTFLKENGIASPNLLKGKKVWFRKTMAWSPTAKKEVPSLRIDKVE